MIGLEDPVLDFVVEPVTHLAVYDVADVTVLKEIVAWESPAWPVTPVGADSVVAANDGCGNPVTKPIKMGIPVKRNNHLETRLISSRNPT